MRILQREGTRLKQQGRSIGKQYSLYTRNRRVTKQKAGEGPSRIEDAALERTLKKMPEHKRQKLLMRYQVFHNADREKKFSVFTDHYPGMEDESLEKAEKADSREAARHREEARTRQAQSEGTGQSSQQQRAIGDRQEQRGQEGFAGETEGNIGSRSLARRIARKVLPSGAREQGREEAQAEAQRQAAAQKQATMPVRKGTKLGFMKIGAVALDAIAMLSPLGIALLIMLLLLVVLLSIFGSLQSGTASAVNLDPQVEAYRSMVTDVAGRYRMNEYVDLLLAVMMQESAGRGTDPMQASESGYNTKYPRVPGSIKDPEYSIECGIQALHDVIEAAGVVGSTDIVSIKVALQGYNFGTGYIRWMHENGWYEWSFETACRFAENTGWGKRKDPESPAGPWKYGDQYYPEHVLRYYTLAAGTELPVDGLAIPIYHQYDYQQSYGDGTIAQNGCGPTSFAMVASYLTGTAITPADVVAWCGDRYYVAGQGTSWGFFTAAVSHYGIGSVRVTYRASEVKNALQAGKPVISSQAPGIFTKHGHFIVLRGITPDGKILVNDPNDNSKKQFAARKFDLGSEIDATSKSYWIFEARKTTPTPIPTAAPTAGQEIG